MFDEVNLIFDTMLNKFKRKDWGQEKIWSGGTPPLQFFSLPQSFLLNLFNMAARNRIRLIEFSARLPAMQANPCVLVIIYVSAVFGTDLASQHLKSWPIRLQIYLEGLSLEHYFDSR